MCTAGWSCATNVWDATAEEKKEGGGRRESDGKAEKSLQTDTGQTKKSKIR